MALSCDCGSVCSTYVLPSNPCSPLSSLPSPPSPPPPVPFLSALTVFQELLMRLLNAMTMFISLTEILQLILKVRVEEVKWWSLDVTW